MGKYNVLWCRILEFKEEVESETEEEAYEKILEERKTAGSAIEIISVMPIDIEEVKEKGKMKKEKPITFTRRVAGGSTVEHPKVGSEKVEQKSKEKK